MALLDSGADVSVMDREVAERFGWIKDVIPARVEAESFEGRVVATLKKKVTLRVEVPGVETDVDFYLMEFARQRGKLILSRGDMASLGMYVTNVPANFKEREEVTDEGWASKELSVEGKKVEQKDENQLAEFKKLIGESPHRNLVLDSMGARRGIEHMIPLTEEMPVSQRQYPIAQKWLGKTHERILEWVRNGW